jgi:hypothetical protein
MVFPRFGRSLLLDEAGRPDLLMTFINNLLKVAGTKEVRKITHGGR